MITSADLKKGDEVILINGWHATVVEKRGKNPVRITLDVRGFFREVGDVFTHEIMGKIDDEGFIQFLSLTPAQKKCKAEVDAIA